MKCPACFQENIPGVDLCAQCGYDLAGLDLPGALEDDVLFERPIPETRRKEAIVLPEIATVAQALERLVATGEGCVCVVDDLGRLTGVFTERDHCVRVAAAGRDPRNTILRDVMTRSPKVLASDDPLAFALYRMGVDGLRHLPILEEGRLIGFLSVRTVLDLLGRTPRGEGSGLQPT